MHFSTSSGDSFKIVGIIVDGFLKSDYNNIDFTGSDLELQLKEYIKAEKIPAFNSQIESCKELLLRSCQQELRYRFD
jgi:hypothetical protein